MSISRKVLLCLKVIALLAMVLGNSTALAGQHTPQNATQNNVDSSIDFHSLNHQHHSQNSQLNNHSHTGYQGCGHCHTDAPKISSHACCVFFLGYQINGFPYFDMNSVEKWQLIQKKGKPFSSVDSLYKPPIILS